MAKTNAMKEGFEEGFKIGLEEGRRQENKRLNLLNHILYEEGRMDDLFNSFTDFNLQKKLLKEYGLIT